MSFVIFRRASFAALLLVPVVAIGQQPPAQSGQAGQSQPPAQQPAAGAAKAGTDVKLNTFEEKLSYAVGLNAGRMMQQQGLNPDPDLFMLGFKDSFNDADPLMTDEQIQELFAQVQQELQKKAADAQKKMAENWDATFAEKNKPAGEPKATRSGLKYEVYQEGKGNKPKATDVVVVHYAGKFPDGKPFDSSIERGEPAVFQLDQVIKGWTEGLQLMPVGSKYKFFIPSALAYGEAGRPPRIPGNQDLVFEVELIDILPQNGTGEAPQE